MKKQIINMDWTIESVRDLKWINEEKTLLDCYVKFNVFNEEIAFSININDMYQHSLDLWAGAIAGEYGEIADYVAPHKTEFEELMENYKNQFGDSFSLDKI